MGTEIRADYQQQFLFPVCLEDWVGPNHPARFIREVVDALNLQELGFAQRVSEDGRPGYAADLLLKVWLYGYMNGVRSPRKLERACHEHVSLLWLTGRNAPDHNTLWRFWRGHRGALRAVLRAILRLAVRGGMVELVLHAVDGTKVIAQASKERLRTRHSLEKELGVLDAAIDEVLEETAEAGAAEAIASGYRLPEQWQQAVLRREQLRELMQQIEHDDRGQIHELERGARLAKTRSAGTALTHNAQAVVDATGGLIVASEVLEENTDNHALVPMLEEVKQNLGASARETLADAGYYSGAELAGAEEHGFAVLVNEQAGPSTPDIAPPDFHHSRFHYDAAADCCICPRGEKLPFERVKVDPQRWRDQARVYRCKSFRSCPVREQCSRDPRGRSIRISPHQQAMLRQREKQQQPGTRDLLRQRAQIIEPVFGIIKEVMGFRRFSVAGPENVRTQWALICTAFNLRKLFRRWCANQFRLAPHLVASP